MDDIITGLMGTLSSTSSNYLDAGNPEFYPYNVPSSAEYPYVTLDDTTAEVWDTISGVESGYEVPMRFLVQVTDESGGTQKATEITNAIESTLDRNHFGINNGNVIFCKVLDKSKPLESPQEKGFFWQFIDVRIMTERS